MLNLLMENSLKEKNNLITEGIDAEFYQVIVGEILKDRIKSFLGHHIAEVQPFNQPSGYIFARKETFGGEGTTDAGDFKIIKKQIDVQTNKTIVKITQEAWEDLLNLSNISKKDDRNKEVTPELFIKWLKATTGFKETLHLLKLLKDNAEQSSPLILSEANDAKLNAETNLFYISKKVNDLIIKMNSKTFRTYDGFCILPQRDIGGILSLSFTYSRIDDSNDENRANDYFIGKINNTRYYLNPDASETNAIVGLRSHKETGVNTLIYSPYNMNISISNDYSTGGKSVAIFSRNAYAISPLHTTDNPMLYKFEIQS